MGDLFKSILKNMHTTKEEILKEHEKLVKRVNRAFEAFNPLKFERINVEELQLYSCAQNQVLYAKTVADPAYVDSGTVTVVEDSKAVCCRLELAGHFEFPKHSCIAVLEPTLSISAGAMTIQVHSQAQVCMFSGEEQRDFPSNFYLAKGKALFREGKFEEALGKFSAGLNLDSRNVELLVNSAACALKLQSFDNALVFTKWALEIEPSCAQAAQIRVNCLIQTNRVAEAKALLDNTQNTPRKERTFTEKRPLRCNRTRLTRLKELVLVEWPKLVSNEKIKKKLIENSVPVDRVSTRGKTAILVYDTVEKREKARNQLILLEDSEFMLANEPAPVN